MNAVINNVIRQGRNYMSWPIFARSLWPETLKVSFYGPKGPKAKETEESTCSEDFSKFYLPS